MFYSEKRAKEFLEKEGYSILKSFYAENENSIRKLKLNFPVVVKISGKNIVHKKKMGGVKLDIKSYDEAIRAFNEIKKIKGYEGVIIQSQIRGNEFFMGIKKTPDFGHAVVYGAGGSNVEQIKDISFRIIPIKKEDAREMIKETKIGRTVNKKEEELIVNNLIKFNSIAEKYPNILELDINPLMINKKGAFVVDARIVFE